MTDLKQLKEQLIAQHPYKFELHAHSNPASACSEFSPAELVERCKNAGAHGLVLTNHAIWWMKETPKEEWCAQYLKDYREAKEAGERMGLQIILGFEIHFSDSSNDYLVFGYDESFVPTVYDWMDKTAKEFYDAFSNEDALIIQAHPNRNNMVEMERDCVDGYEVFNLHPGHNSRVAFAARLHKKNGGIVTGGTDFHHRGHEGSLFTCFSTLPQDGKDLVRLLRNGDYLFLVGDQIILP
jgi:histidinol phosphatase-like PHP family hydrolase